MAALFKTNLVVVAAPLPPDFIGDPQEFFDALIERMEVQSPVGTQFFVVGDAEPDGNQGPWLKNGDRWYVFSASQGKYVPINVDDSVRLFVVGPDTPASPGSTDPLIWLRTSGTRAISWYAWDGTIWRPVGGVPPSGTTAERPTVPVDLEQFFDTSISTMLHFERGAWRTLSGTPGDIKYTAVATLAQALTFNPGWGYLGQDDQSVRGKVLGTATQDPGATPVTVYSVDSGITPRASGDQVGEETHVLTSDEIEQHTHLLGHSTFLNSDNNILIHRVDNAEILTIPPVVPPNHFQVNGEGSTNGTKLGTAGDGSAGTMLITSRQLSLANAAAYTGTATAHNTMQPTVFLWALVKL